MIFSDRFKGLEQSRIKHFFGLSSSDVCLRCRIEAFGSISFNTESFQSVFLETAFFVSTMVLEDYRTYPHKILTISSQ